MKIQANQKVAKYFPLSNGKYEVKAGLHSLNTDFGNLSIDKYLFQIDKTYRAYRENKNTARQENLEQYYCSNKFSIHQQQVICNFIINNLCHDYPQYFSVTKQDEKIRFKNNLLNEEFTFSLDNQLISSIGYLNLLDALMMQIQEDIAVISQHNYIACLHLMAPNFWAAQDKIGKSFASIHQEVAGIESIIKHSKAILHAMINRGPYVRFAWGITCDEQLNHHPNLTPSKHRNAHSDRQFDINNPNLYLRVERQTTTGFPDSHCALFTIRSYHYQIKHLAKTEIQCIINAINTMTQKQRIYKALDLSHLDIIKWLSSLL